MIRRALIICMTSVLAMGSFNITTANQAGPEASLQAAASSQFVKKRYSIKGEWSVVEKDGQTQIRFSDAFKTKGGPDLKVFLSQTPIHELDSKTAAKNALSIGVLKSKSGGQIYTVPDDVDIADYKSVIIHCEAFSVLWGGFDLPVVAHQTAQKP